MYSLSDGKFYYELLSDFFTGVDCSSDRPLIMVEKNYWAHVHC